MDAALSNGKNDQGTQYNGKNAPEYVIAETDKDDDFGENHQRLLFGGNTSPSTEISAESTITPTVRTSASVQQARDTAPELNLVNIVPLNTPAAARSDVRPSAPAASYESNPLPTQAKLGVARTIGLQESNSENVTPPGRRSGASDRVAIQLTNDSTPAPILTAVRMSDLDPATKHQMVLASTNDLFERLGQPVPVGTKDDTTMSVKTGGATRRIAEPIESYNASPSQLPVISGNPSRGSTDNRTSALIAGVPNILPDVAGIAYGAQPRANSDTQFSLTSTIPGAKIKPLTDTQVLQNDTASNGMQKNASQPLVASDNANLPRANRSPSDAMMATITGGLQNAADIVNNNLPAIRRSTSTDHANIQPVPLDPATSIGRPARQTDDPVRQPRQGDPVAVLPLTAVLNNRIAAPAADPVSAGDPKVGELVRGVLQTGNIIVSSDKGPGKTSSSPADTLVSGIPSAMRPVSNTAGDIVPTNNRNNSSDSPLQSLTPRRDSQPVAPTARTVPIFVDGGTVLVAATRPANCETPVNALPSAGAGVSKDGVVPKVESRNAVTDFGNQSGNSLRGILGTTVEQLNANANANPNPRPGDPATPRVDQTSHALPGVVKNDGLPLPQNQPVNSRNGDPIPALRDGVVTQDKQGKDPITGAALRISDGALPAGNNVPGGNNVLNAADRNLGKSGDPAASVDRGPGRIADGRQPDIGRLSETPAKNSDPVSRNGDPVSRNGDPVSRNGDPVGRNGDPVSRNGDPVGRSAETIARASDSVARNTEPAGRAGESTIRTTDGAAKVTGEGIARAVDGAGKGNDSISRAADTGVKGVEIGGKAQDNARIDDGTKLADSGIKLADGSVKSVDGQAKVVLDALNVSGKSIEVAGRVAGDAIAKGGDVSVRVNDQNITGRWQDSIANNGLVVSADKNIRLADAIVKAADQGAKGADINQSAKLDGSARVSDQNIQNVQNAQNILINNQLIAGLQNNQAIVNNQQIKSEAGRSDANAGARISDQNQMIAPPGIQNHIAAQNQSAAIAGKDQVAAQNVKATPEALVPGQRNSGIHNADIKVEQVVADILNNVRNNGKDQQAGAKILSSLDQTNAANQQLVQGGLLDAAAVRRIFDGQGIALSPATLDSIMEGLRPTGEHAVDYALPSIGSLNLSQIISLGERLQEAVAGAGNETSEPQNKPQLQQNRTKYIVKEEDTLESIAQEKLGDARLVQLLITINRALINYRLEDETKVAYVVPNQYLWLPTDHELEIHKRNFFGKHGKDGSVSLGISSKQNTPLIPPVSFDQTREVSAEVSASWQDFRPSYNPSSNPLSGNRINSGYQQQKPASAGGSISGSETGSTNGAPGDSNNAGKMAGNLDKLRHAGGRQSVRLDQIEHASAQVSHRQCYQVLEGETLMSIAASLQSIGHISMWKLLAKINGFQIEEGGLGKSLENLYAGQFIVLPTTEELNEFKLLEKLTVCTQSEAGKAPAGAADNAFRCVVEPKHVASPPPPALVALAQGVGGLTTVHRLSSYTRLVLTDLPELENCFSITVEARWNGQWKPMAAYECRHGQTTRHLYNKHGEIKSMELELPPYVIKEMAREDFIRNWNSYVNSFMDNSTERYAQS